ncbi:MAG TPA: hypothetical protein VGH44_01130 [Candidatus Saccharimonadia bacterium]
MPLSELVVNPHEGIFDSDDPETVAAEEAGRRSVREVLGIEVPAPAWKPGGMPLTKLVVDPYEGFGGYAADSNEAPAVRGSVEQ